MPSAMRRREFITVCGGATAAWPVLAGAQQPRAPGAPRIGLLSIGTDPVKPNPVWVQFLHQLEQLGYVDGRNITIERRFAVGARNVWQNSSPT